MVLADVSRKINGSGRNLVLVGFAEALSAPEVTWSLVDAGFQVVAFSRKGRSSALQHSRHVTTCEITSPEISTDLAVRDLAEVLRTCAGPGSMARPVLFPLNDPAVWLCNEVPLGSGWVLAGPSRTGAEFALDKRIQVDAARAAGFRVPQTTIATAASEVLDRAGCLPLILRPAMAVSSEAGRLRTGSNWICANREELENAVGQWREQYPVLVQPFISGTGEGVFGLATSHGVQAWSAHRRLRMMNPHGSGSSACASQPVPENLRIPVETLIREFDWRGLFMIELLRDDSGTVWFVEFNGRPWGSISLSRRQGFEYPAWAVNLALNTPWRLDAEISDGRAIVCRNLGRELMHLLFVLRGPKTAAIKAWPSFWRSAAGILRVRRGDALYNWRRDDLGVFVKDCCYTIRDQVFKTKP